MAATGCSAAPPTAADVIRATEDVRDSSTRPLLVEPRPGRGTAVLPEFAPDGPFSVTVRCLGPASVGLTIGEETVPAEDCSDGMLGVGRGADDEAVRVSIDAPEDAYWVAGVIQCEAVEKGVAC